MEKHTKERIDMIIGMIMVITKMRENDVADTIRGTKVYRNIINGEECTWYEDYSANIMSIVKELKRKNIDSVICAITPSSVSELNQQMFHDEIKNAEQLKKKLYNGYIDGIISVLYKNKLQNQKNQALKPKTPMVVYGKKRAASKIATVRKKRTVFSKLEDEQKGVMAEKAEKRYFRQKKKVGARMK